MPTPVIIDCDPGHDDAMALLLAPHPELMLSAELAERLRLTGRAGAAVADLHAFYRRFHERLDGHSDAPIHDALAVGAVVNPDLLVTEYVPVEIDLTLRPSRGRTVVDRLNRTGAPPNAHVAVDVDGPALIGLLTERIGSLA